MTDGFLPAPVLASLAGDPAAELLSCTVERLAGGTGAATAEVSRLTVRTDRGVFSLVRKRFRPVTTGRHAAAAGDPRHWAYWRREPLAYASGLLPAGPGLAAPRCHGVVDDTVYLQDVPGTPESPELAAHRLGTWQATTPVPDVPWLAGHQLAQRVAVSDLDWTALDADPRMARIWYRRHTLLSRLERAPLVPSHGDFHPGNLAALGDRTVVLDWGTLGAAPAGADLAHLALGTLTDHTAAYLDGLGGRFATRDALAGYRVTLALTGASRVHWMLSRGIAVPPGYADFVAGASGHG